MDMESVLVMLGTVELVSPQVTVVGREREERADVAPGAPAWGCEGVGG